MLKYCIAGLSFNNQLPRWLMRSLPEKISAFMGKRRTNIHKLYTELAAKIVNFDSIQEIDKLNRVQQFGISPLPKLQEKYVKYAQQMVGVENLGVEVNKGHELTKLLLCIQRERLWVKQYNKNIDIEYFAGGDGYGIKQEKCADTFDKADSSTPLVGLRRRNAGKVFEVTKVRTGEKSIFARPDRRQAKVLPDKNKGKVSTTKYEGEGDDDEGSVLYGLICA